jgi:integrase
MMVEGNQKIPLVLKFEDWPVQDQTAWDAIFLAGSLFDDKRTCEHWSEGTRRMRQQGYGQWLSFMLRTYPELAQLEPATRITCERVQEFIVESEARLSNRSIANLVNSLASLAQVMAPHHDWGWLWHAGARLYRQSDPYALKPRIPLSATDVFRWSLNRMAQVENETGLEAPTRAMQFRQALMVGLLISRPVRARAFVNMKLHRHLEACPDGYQLRFYPGDMKDRRARSYPLPIKLSVPLARYLSIFRPDLLDGAKSEALWISTRGNPLSQDSFTSGLALLTKRHFGLALRPHAFRHIAATSIAEVDPRHVGIIRDILGHSTLNMAERHYNRATGITAANRMQSLVRDIRRASSKMEHGNHRRHHH